MELNDLDTELLINELQNRGYIRVLWRRDDVLHTAEEMGVILHDDEIDSIMYNIENKHDANYGVNWDFIQFIIDDVISNREK
jgi:hypothetical protein